MAGILAVCLLLAGAPPAESDPAGSVSSYHLARADPRLCPSPTCGGIWVRLVNREVTTCGDGAERRECYAASADLSSLSVDEKSRVQLQGLVTEGRALARGTLVRGRVGGFPELETLVVSEVWPASSSLNRPRGVFRRLRDNGVRCIAAPCFSIQAAVLNSKRSANVSRIDLSRTGAAAGERRRALERLTAEGVLAAGEIVRDSRAGSRDGRVFRASQLYVGAK